MKVIIIFAVILAAVYAQQVPSLDLRAPIRESAVNVPQSQFKAPVKSVTVVRDNASQFGATKAVSEDSLNQGNGNYRYSYETENGIKVEETGTLKGESESVQGSYSFISPEGQTFSVRYIADENGFQPVGDHLPTSPPVPEAIVKLLKYLSENEKN